MKSSLDEGRKAPPPSSSTAASTSVAAPTSPASPANKTFYSRDDIYLINRLRGLELSANEGGFINDASSSNVSRPSVITASSSSSSSTAATAAVVSSNSGTKPNIQIISTKKVQQIERQYATCSTSSGSSINFRQANIRSASSGDQIDACAPSGARSANNPFLTSSSSIVSHNRVMKSSRSVDPSLLQRRNSTELILQTLQESSSNASETPHHPHYHHHHRQQSLNLITNPFYQPVPMPLKQREVNMAASRGSITCSTTSTSEGSSVECPDDHIEDDGLNMDFQGLQEALVDDPEDDLDEDGDEPLTDPIGSPHFHCHHHDHPHEVQLPSCEASLLGNGQAGCYSNQMIINTNLGPHSIRPHANHHSNEMPRDLDVMYVNSCSCCQSQMSAQSTGTISICDHHHPHQVFGHHHAHHRQHHQPSPVHHSPHLPHTYSPHHQMREYLSPQHLAVKESLERDPIDRNAEDLEAIKKFINLFPTFDRFSENQKFLLSTCIVLATIPPQTTILNDGELLDSYCVLVNGTCEHHLTIDHGHGSNQPYMKILYPGEAFGILEPTLHAVHFEGEMKTCASSTCWFLCVSQHDYYSICVHHALPSTLPHDLLSQQDIISIDDQSIPLHEVSDLSNTSTLTMGNHSGIANSSTDTLISGHHSEHPHLHHSNLMKLQGQQQNKDENLRAGEEPSIPSSSSEQQQQPQPETLIRHTETTINPDGTTQEKVVLITQLRHSSDSSSAPIHRKGHVIIRGTPERLLLALIDDDIINADDVISADTLYLDDFLLTFRVFMPRDINDHPDLPSGMHQICSRLISWFDEPPVKDKIVRIFLTWINNYYADFENISRARKFLEQFESKLNSPVNGITSYHQLRLLHVALSTKSKQRQVTLTRSTRDEELNVHVVGGYERGFGIFVDHVDPGSRAEAVGIRRGDQLLEVNGVNFKVIPLSRALQVLTSSTHLSLELKYNPYEFYEISQLPEGARKSSRIPATFFGNYVPPTSYPVGGENSTKVLGPSGSKNGGSNDKDRKIPKIRRLQEKLPKFIQSRLPGNNSTTLATSSRENLSKGPVQRSLSNPDLSSMTDSASRDSGFSRDSVTSIVSNTSRETFDLESFPGSSSLPAPSSSSLPQHVVKVFNAANGDSRYLLIHQETTAREVCMVAVHEFGLTSLSRDKSSLNFSLYEVSVVVSQRDPSNPSAPVTTTAKTRRLPDQLANLAQRLSLHARYYVKENESIGSEPKSSSMSSSITASNNFGDDIMHDIIKEVPVQVTFHHLNSLHAALYLTSRDFNTFRSIEPQEFLYDLFKDELEKEFNHHSNSSGSGTGTMTRNQKSSNSTSSSTSSTSTTKDINETSKPSTNSNLLNDWTKNLKKFSETSNQEMFWCVSEILNEPNLHKRARIIKSMIKIAVNLRRVQNFNSCFAIISGLNHASVTRLKSTWEKVPAKHMKFLRSLQCLLDPTRNMFNYRRELSSCSAPMIPFWPIVRKDLTFIHLANKTIHSQDGLVNFDKMRMLCREIRTLTHMTSREYNFNPVAIHGGGMSKDVRDLKRMWDEFMEQKKVDTYFEKISIEEDEDKLMAKSLELEQHIQQSSGLISSSSLRGDRPSISVNVNVGGTSVSGTQGQPVTTISSTRAQPSPTLSSASSASNSSNSTAGIQRYGHLPGMYSQQALKLKFGAESPQKLRKILSLSDGSREKSTRELHHAQQQAMMRANHGPVHAPLHPLSSSYGTSHPMSMYPSSSNIPGQGTTLNRGGLQYPNYVTAPRLPSSTPTSQHYRSVSDGSGPQAPVSGLAMTSAVGFGPGAGGFPAPMLSSGGQGSGRSIPLPPESSSVTSVRSFYYPSSSSSGTSLSKSNANSTSSSSANVNAHAAAQGSTSVSGSGNSNVACPSAQSQSAQSQQRNPPNYEETIKRVYPNRVQQQQQQPGQSSTLKRNKGHPPAKPTVSSSSTASDAQSLNEDDPSNKRNVSAV